MVLTPIILEDLKTVFDQIAIGVLDFFIHKSIFAQPEPLEKQSPLPIFIPKEHIEQWAVQSLGVEPVGAGSYPLDVIKKNEWGADIKMLSCKVTDSGEIKNGDSGETSLGQKFKETGEDLDVYFKNENFDSILKGFGGIVYNKLLSAIKDQQIDKIYYFFLLRAGTRFFLCGLNVDIEEIKKIGVLKTTTNSAWAKNYIDERYGNVKVYKAKKRIELRLRPANWLEDNLLLELAIPKAPAQKNIRELIQNKDDFLRYKENIIETIFNGKIK